MDTGRIDFDDSRWPVLIIRFAGHVSDAQFQAYLDRYETYMRRGTRYAIVLVTPPDMPMTKPKHARLQASWIGERAELLRQVCAGCGFSLPSPVARGVLRAILSVQRLPMPYEVFRDEAPAIDWARATLARDPTRRPPTQ